MTNGFPAPREMCYILTLRLTDMYVAHSKQRNDHHLRDITHRMEGVWFGQVTTPSHLANFDRQPNPNLLVGLAVKASASRAEDPGFECRWRWDFSGSSTLAFQWLPCQAPDVLWSALGLVGRVSVYCDWVRQKNQSAASTSVWHHVHLSEQIRP